MKPQFVTNSAQWTVGCDDGIHCQNPVWVRDGPRQKAWLDIAVVSAVTGCEMALLDLVPTVATAGAFACKGQKPAGEAKTGQEQAHGIALNAYQGKID